MNISYVINNFNIKELNMLFKVKVFRVCKSTLTHKILFIYKEVHDITILPLVLMTLPLKLESIYHTILACYIINPN